MLFPHFRRASIWKLIIAVTTMTILTKVMVTSLLADRQIGCVWKIRERPSQDTVAGRTQNRI